MKNPRLALPLAAFALTQCSANPPPAPPPPPPSIAFSGQDTTPAPAVDLSEVPTPAGLLLDVRLASARGFAQKLGRLTGMNDGMVDLLEGAMPGMLGDDEGLASVIDLNAPVDISVFVPPERRRARLVLSMGAGDLAHAATALSDGHALATEPNGVRRVTQTGHSDPDPSCVLAPAFGTSGSRVLCGDRGEDFTGLIPYMTRTLPRRPLDAAQSDLVASVAMAQFRASQGDEWRRTATQLTNEFGFAQAASDAPLEAARAWARDMMQSIPRVLEDVGAADLRLSLPDTGAEANATFRIEHTTAPALRQLLDITHDPNPPFADLARLPAGGWLYAAASLSLQQLRPSLNVLPTLITRELLQGTPTPNGEGAALNTAIASLLAQDRITYATSIGTDPAGRYWNVSRFQATTPPAQLVSNLRTFFTTLSRPAISRPVLAHHHIQLAQWHTMPTVGLPPGSLLVRVPFERLHAATPATPVRGPRPAATPPPPPAPVYEFLFVPDGAQVWFVAATNSRERLRAAQAAHPAPVDAATLQGDGVSLGAAIIPAAAVSLFQDDPSFMRMLTRLVQGATDHGMTPATVRLSTTQGTTNELTVRATVPRATLELVGQAMHGAGGAAPPHP